MKRVEKSILIALGGNAFQTKGERGTPENYWRNAYKAAETIVDIISHGYKVVVTHGNGPQVGIILEWMDRSKDVIPPLTMDIAGAMTQGWLGYLLSQAIYNVLKKRGVVNSVKGVVSLVNQVLVSKDDPAWENPTKYVGSYYSKEDAKRIAKERGWVFKPDPRGGYRRVVPSPDPKMNVEMEAIKKLVEEGYIVIASGGGGIPVVLEDSTIKGVEAVIDKDLAGEVLASGLGVEIFIIMTDVDGVYINFRKPNEERLEKVKLSEIERYYKEGHFGAGSMGPKVLAAIRFLKKGGNKAIIGHLRDGYKLVTGEAGTVIIPD